MGWIGRAWRGETRLWVAFWIYGALLNLVLNCIGAAIRFKFGATPYLLFWIPYLVYFIWITVAHWRCAFNAQWTIWSYVVRILVVLEIIGVLFALAGLLFGGVIIGQDLMKAAQCRKELQEYVAKGGKDTEGFKKQCIARVTHKDAESADGTPTTSAGSAIMKGIDAGFECAKKASAYQKAGGADPKAFQKKCIDDYMQSFKQSLTPQGNAKPDAAAQGNAQPVAVTPGTEKFKAQCEKAMTDVAQKSGVDPKGYIAQNQAYLQQCIQYYVQGGQ